MCPLIGCECFELIWRLGRWIYQPRGINLSVDWVVLYFCIIENWDVMALYRQVGMNSNINHKVVIVFLKYFCTYKLSFSRLHIQILLFYKVLLFSGFVLFATIFSCSIIFLQASLACRKLFQKQNFSIWKGKILSSKRFH